MNNSCLLSPSERLQDWRKFRERLHLCSFSYMVTDLVIDWWSSMPFTLRSIDIYDSKQWPTPWELVYYGDYCKSSISLGMAYTLCLIGDDWKARTKLLMIDDNGLDIFLVVLLDDKYLINYSYKQIIEFDSLNDVKVLETFSCDDHLNFTQSRKEANETIL